MFKALGGSNNYVDAVGYIAEGIASKKTNMLDRVLGIDKDKVELDKVNTLYQAQMIKNLPGYQVKDGWFDPNKSLLDRPSFQKSSQQNYQRPSRRGRVGRYGRGGKKLSDIKKEIETKLVEKQKVKEARLEAQQKAREEKISEKRRKKELREIIKKEKEMERERIKQRKAEAKESKVTK